MSYLTPPGKLPTQRVLQMSSSLRILVLALFAPAIAIAVAQSAEPAAVVPGGSVASVPDVGGAYLIQAGDTLAVSVWKETDLQAEVLVRSDGGISFPLAGDLKVAGRSVADVRAELVERLQRYIPDPVVTVAVKQINGNRVYVVGKVNRPGVFEFSQPIDVMQALSLAGGATPFAALNDIRILRRENGQQTSIRFRYADVARGSHLERNILLRSGDTVVVP